MAPWLQEAAHVKGRLIELLPPPLLPTGWEGSFQRSLPLAGGALHDVLTPCCPAAAWSRATSWMPPLVLAPAPLIATIQLDVLPDACVHNVAGARSSTAGQLGALDGRRLLTADGTGVVPWPEELVCKGRIAIHVPQLDIIVSVDDAPDGEVSGDDVDEALDI